MMNNPEEAKRVIEVLSRALKADADTISESSVLDELDEALDARCPVCEGKITLLTLAVMKMCGDCEDDHLETRF